MMRSIDEFFSPRIVSFPFFNLFVFSKAQRLTNVNAKLLNVSHYMDGCLYKMFIHAVASNPKLH